MKIVCILGRSRSGKFDVEKNLEKLGFSRVVSYTTRKKRDGERDGEQYHFVDRVEFERLIKLNAFMEYAEYNGDYYGAPKPIGHKNNIIVVESDGYRQIKELFGEQAIGVYVNNQEDKGARNALESNEDRENKRLADDLKFDNICDEVDIVINNNTDVSTQTAIILSYVRGIDAV